MSRPETFILDANRRPVVEPDLLKWAQWFNGRDRIVAQERADGVTVSTVFLGLDHNYLGEGPPILWETMVFGGPMDQHQKRCAGNWEQAEAMHAEVVARVFGNMVEKHAKGEG